MKVRGKVLQEVVKHRKLRKLILEIAKTIVWTRKKARHNNYNQLYGFRIHLFSCLPFCFLDTILSFSYSFDRVYSTPLLFCNVLIMFCSFIFCNPRLDYKKFTFFYTPVHASCYKWKYFHHHHLNHSTRYTAGFLHQYTWNF